MKFIKFILIAILAMPVGVFAQGVIGPPYNPSQVMVYDGYYTAPVTVYSDKTTTVYIGDLTSNQAIVDILYCDHQSTVFMYFYSKQTGVITSYMVSFWIDKKIIQSELTLPGQFVTPENYTFKSAPPILLASVLRTVHVTDEEAAGQNLTCPQK